MSTMLHMSVYSLYPWTRVFLIAVVYTLCYSFQNIPHIIVEVQLLLILYVHYVTAVRIFPYTYNWVKYFTCVRLLLYVYDVTVVCLFPYHCSRFLLIVTVCPLCYSCQNIPKYSQHHCLRFILIVIVCPLCYRCQNFPQSPCWIFLLIAIVCPLCHSCRSSHYIIFQYFSWLTLYVHYVTAVRIILIAIVCLLFYSCQNIPHYIVNNFILIAVKCLLLSENFPYPC